MRLADLVKPEQVVANLRSRDKLEIIEELADLLVNDDERLSKKDVCRVLAERERLRSTGVGSGVAIPHAKVPGLDRLLLAVGLSPGGVDFDAADSKPVHIFMTLAAPVNSTGEHLRALAKIARLCGDPEFRQRLLSSSSDEEAYRILIEEDKRITH